MKVTNPAIAGAPAADHPEWMESARLQPTPSLPVLAAAFVAGTLLVTTRPGRGLVRGLLRAALLLARPAVIAGGLYKLGQPSIHSSPRP